jgi:hypothetical protein
VSEMSLEDKRRHSDALSVLGHFIDSPMMKNALQMPTQHDQVQRVIDAVNVLRELISPIDYNALGPGKPKVNL